MVVLICVDHEETTWQVTSIPFSRAKQQRTGTARWQNNETNYRRQKAHVNMWNKADICAILLSNETSTAPFRCCLQNVADISRTNIHRFVQEETLNFSKNRNIQGNQSKDILSKIQALWRNIFLASRRWCCCPHLLKVPSTARQPGLPVLNTVVLYTKLEWVICIWRNNNFPLVHTDCVISPLLWLKAASLCGFQRLEAQRFFLKCSH